MRLGISSGLMHSTAVEWAEKQVALGCRSVVFPLNCEAPKELIDEYVSEAKKHDLLVAKRIANIIDFGREEQIYALRKSAKWLAENANRQEDYHG